MHPAGVQGLRCPPLALPCKRCRDWWWALQLRRQGGQKFCQSHQRQKPRQGAHISTQLPPERSWLSVPRLVASHSLDSALLGLLERGRQLSGWNPSRQSSTRRLASVWSLPPTRPSSTSGFLRLLGRETAGPSGSTGMARRRGYIAPGTWQPQHPYTTGSITPHPAASSGASSRTAPS